MKLSLSFPRLLVCLSIVAALNGAAAPIPGLFNTGVSDVNVPLASGAVDLHWRMIQSADAAFQGPMQSS